MRRCCFALLPLLITLSAIAADAQNPSGPPQESGPAVKAAAGGWHGALSVANLFDGNVSHDVTPIRSYGVVPAASVTFDSAADGAFSFGYEIATNSYTGTDEWDRISHNLFTTLQHRLGKRLRLETDTEASWKGSSEDRELANVFGVSQRVVYRVSKATRVALTGTYRYKQYPDDPGTSGPSPSVGAKIDRRLRGDGRLTLSYKYQSRLSEVARNRYYRNAYALEWSTPMIAGQDRLSLGFEYRPQRYNRLIKVDGQQVVREDRRITAAAEYRRPINDRVEARWTGGLESRRSNDPTKLFMAPTFGMTMSYRLR